MGYLVTVYHVIEDLGAVTLRFNTRSGEIRIAKDWPFDHWVTNPKLDIALVFPLIALSTNEAGLCRLGSQLYPRSKHSET
jgi:hypothetical protein